ncbi:kinase-like domain-containing protein [Rhizophagus irregularis DAOM 181602=DAOM 197198]|nr:kinase-like domain-containing protein [Rhizophagus irregularis DAOM 181602=DAOM 197198]POG63962.1 kinase-like domain-containing protein [Rhizophagus irregularis DAOM 181602=DAOM 197198]|eukprot:XP_025170828.1 kinase-like domain-containing protein [Rhizophagus irregularis DAOM 181602=DAOM 197198]
MIITEYHELGDLTHYVTNDFFNISWKGKLEMLFGIAVGINKIHAANVIHKDYHTGNIFVSSSYTRTTTGDLGLSKSSLNDDEDNEVYGIIPYVAPEVLQGQNYTKASDIYSYGMIMWELMTGRRPFWDRNHDTDLIIEICDGFRPPIVTNAPEDYIELMQSCWHPDPNKRPIAEDLFLTFYNGKLNNVNERNKPTQIIETSDIGPITNKPGAIYKSRPLSAMIRSAESTRSLRSQNIHNNTLSINKRKFNNVLIKNNEKDEPIKRIKLFESDNDDYLTKELELDIDDNKLDSNDYITEEINFDI